MSLYRNLHKIFYVNFSNQSWYPGLRNFMNKKVRPTKNRIKFLLSFLFDRFGIQILWEEYSAVAGIGMNRFIVVRGFEGTSYIGKKYFINRNNLIRSFSTKTKFLSYTKGIVDGCGKSRIPISIVEASMVKDGSFEIQKEFSLRAYDRNHSIGGGKKTVFLPLGFEHFGHFIYQVLPIFLRNSTHQFAMNVIEKNDKNRIIEILDFFSIKHSRIRSQGKPFRIQLSANQSGLYPGAQDSTLMAAKVREKIGRVPQEKYVFLSRGNAPQGRTIINENEFTEEIMKFGFETIDPGDLTFSEQMELFSAARVVIGAHGSALANIIAMQEESRIIELAGENYVRWHVKKLSADLKLKHSLLICESDENENFYVNMGIFRKILMENLQAN